MSEAVAGLIARQRTEELAGGALPGSPLRPDRGSSRANAGWQALRCAAGTALHRLAGCVTLAEALPAAGVATGRG